MDISKVYGAVASLIKYGTDHGLLEERDAVYTRNLLLERLKLDSYEASDFRTESLEEMLGILDDYAAEAGLVESNSVVYRDIFDSALMNCLLPRPSEVTAKFNSLYERSPEAATGFYYDFSRASDYIRTYRVAKDIKWTADTEFGEMIITINLSKPEKDPKAIAAALSAKQSDYPKCQLCLENEGYAGRVNHPARMNHRIIPITVNNTPWFLQYSPYVYYNEHCIVFNSEHTPMKIDRAAFDKLLDFVRQFPHYCVGSNADLPIVGGSILTHDHFQGGRFEFPMAKAPVEQTVSIRGFEDVEAGIVKWPMTVLRISGTDTARLAECADAVLKKWRGYSDPDAFIFAYTGENSEIPHNTITPIARMRDGRYELDLVLRNNITTDEHPLGVYHPHAEHHHIKKENIGLIEVMGLAILPARLKTELAALAEAILDGRDLRGDELLAKHADWADGILERYADRLAGIKKESRAEALSRISQILRYETALVYSDILGQCAVFKRTEEGRKQLLKFIGAV